MVTIALPTYRRAGPLQRAIESVLIQDYEPIELIISDNASGDGTRELCEGYAARHPSIRYVQQQVNIGATLNFEQLRPLARGDYFLFLGDDDWIDRNYVSACVESLEANTSFSVVAGLTVFHRVDGYDAEPYPINIFDSDPARRLLEFCRQVRANGVFYGVIPASVNARVPPLRNVMAGDMLHVMALAYLGSIRTLGDVAVHRSVDGMTVSLANVATMLGLGWFQTNAPQIAMAYWTFRDIAVDSPLYAELGKWRRLRLGVRAGAIVFVRFVPHAVAKFTLLRMAAVVSRMRPRMATAQGR